MEQGKEGDNMTLERRLVFGEEQLVIGQLEAGSWYTITVYSVDEAKIIDQNIVAPVVMQTGGRNTFILFFVFLFPYFSLN